MAHPAVGPHYGPHVDRSWSKHGGRPPISAHIAAARQFAAEQGFNATAFQIFVAGPRQLITTLKEEEAVELRAYLAANPSLVVIAHSSYLSNPWGGHRYFARFIRDEVALAGRAGISGLVVHLGVPGLDVVREILPRLVVPGAPVIYLEIPHVLPHHSNYETPEKLAELFRVIREVDPELANFGLCIDTAHVWECGVDLQGYDAAEEWLEGLEARADAIPPGRILFHLNSSWENRGTGKDKHAPLLDGQLWGLYRTDPQDSGLAAFVRYAERHGSTVILERGGLGGKPDYEALKDDYAALLRLDPGLRADEDEARAQIPALP